MKLNLKQIKIIAVIGILLISFLAHFAYDLFPNIIFSFLFPVNESIWEHMKILFTSTLLYSVIDYILLKKNNIKFNNFPFQLYFTAIMIIPLYLAIYIPLYKLFGENAFISIGLLIIVYIIGQYISYQILKQDNYKILNSLSVIVIFSMYLLFIYLTYNPIHNYIFYDTTTNSYGIKENKKKG